MNSNKVFFSQNRAAVITGLTALIQGLTETQKELILMSAWTSYAKAGYGEHIEVATEMLAMDKDRTFKAAQELGSYRPTMVVWFCKKFGLDWLATASILEQLIDQFEREEKGGCDSNSRRFLHGLRNQLANPY